MVTVDCLDAIREAQNARKWLNRYWGLTFGIAIVFGLATIAVVVGLAVERAATLNYLSGFSAVGSFVGLIWIQRERKSANARLTGAAARLDKNCAGQQLSVDEQLPVSVVKILTGEDEREREERKDTTKPPGSQHIDYAAGEEETEEGKGLAGAT
jgi:hypothetical protein